MTPKPNELISGRKKWTENETHLFAQLRQNMQDAASRGDTVAEEGYGRKILLLMMRIAKRQQTAPSDVDTNHA